MKILIADDNAISRRLLEATLQKWGYEVMPVSDGADAWEILQQPDRPPLAILDWMMPGFSGPEICRMLRQQGKEPYTYLLLLTSRSEREDLIAGMESGADDYVTKPFDHHELKVRLRAGVRIVELQSQLVAAREALREQATHDALTGVWNRPAILDILQREIVRSGREQRPLGVVLVDLDHFKTINDTHGHVVGDSVLREAAQRMLQSVRAYDAIGRYGGEEFLILLPGCDSQATENHAERMRAAVGRTPIPLPGLSIELTASFGATTLIPATEANTESLIRAADAGLLQAKATGRDRVRFVSHQLSTVTNHRTA